jgi:hypothetical protein
MSPGDRGFGMSDEQDGQNEKDATPDSGADPLSSRARTAAVIQGEALRVPPSVTPEAPPAESPRLEKPHPEEPPPESPNAAAAQTPRKKSSLRPLVATAGACVLGVAGYYGWTELASRDAIPPDLAQFAAMVRKRVDPPAVVAPADVASPLEAPAVDSPKSDLPKAEPPKTVEAPPEPVKASAAEPTSEKMLAQATARLAAAQAALDQVTERLRTVETRAVEAPHEPDKTPVAESATEKALAEVTSRLAASQTALEHVTARLQAVEGQLAAPKTDSRAQLGERDAGPANVGNASARIVAAQSLLSAIRQGDDYAPMLAALQNLGGDPDRIARLRAGLSAPNAEGLTRDFAALAARILAAAPPAPQPQQAKAPQNFAETALAYVENRAEKLVRIRPASAPDEAETVIRVGRIEKDLARGDIAAALAERAQLPAPALAITADWAASAQAHIDAELAAKAELAAALQGLSKSKS